ncbi:high mobility group nucleosome-binding domain-containing protein 5-like [Scophthalmus maximus]|uniref:high mobility group nucleosome-binding domain-containing protein 5-like n=1 Tax=Scophthalmus maximus TaxID=52904 RepID=UPI001FA8B3A1|nr:high mobility group nucleosome-binding domain-containing protein 5-like [Scophthalmus maximus]
MAAPKENLLCLGHLTGTERNTFTKQREHSLKQSVHRPMLFQTNFSTPQSRQQLRVMHLQQRWQELKERERTAQQHNQQLLQQFDRAQDTLREMLARNAAMKTIRMEYGRYLEESDPGWHQQIKEKTQAAQRKRMEVYLRSCLQNSEGLSKSSPERLLLSQGFAKKPQTVSALRDSNVDVSSHLPCRPSSWLTHTPSQTAGFPINMPCQPQPSHVPPPYLPPPPIFSHPHQSQVHHLASTPGNHHPWPRQDPTGWASPQCDNPWSWTTGATGIPSVSDALWRQLHTEEPAHEREVEAETRGAASSKREGGGGSRSSHCSQELDINPVRLSSGYAESGESGRDSSQTSSEKRKKRERRGKTQRSSSDGEKCNSQESSRTSSAIVIAGETLVQSSESDASSEKCSTSGSRRTARRSGGLAVGSPPTEKVANERTQSERDDCGSHKEGRHSAGEESGSPVEESMSEDAKSQSPEDRSESRGEEESESVSVKTENGDAKTENQESGSSAEQSSAEEKDEEEEEHKNDLGEGANGDGEEESSQRDEEKDVRHVDDDDDDDVSARENTTEDEEETGAEDDWVDEGDKERLKDEDGESRRQDSSFSQDEDENGRDENEIELEGEGSVEEEDGEEEDEKGSEGGSGSDDSIISPQENRQKRLHIIPKEAAEDDGDGDEKTGSKPGSSDEDEFIEDDIENLLAPQEQTKRAEKDLKVDDKPKEACDHVDTFRAEQDHSTKTDHQSDSDEFDHFYD